MSNANSHNLRAIFERHKRDLLRFLTRRVGGQAAPDLLQETFLRVLRYEKIDGVVDARAFLHTTAANLSRDFARRRETEGKYVVADEIGAEHADDAPAQDIIFDARRRTARLLAAVDALPPKCRQVFIMRRFEDLSQQEIADRLGISRNMVEKHLRLALERCRSAMEED